MRPVLALISLSVLISTAVAQPCHDYTGDLRHAGSHLVEYTQDSTVGYTQVRVKGNTAYAWEFQQYYYTLGALQIIDVTDPDEPVALGRLGYGDGVVATGLALIDHFAFLATDLLRIVDVDDSEAPVEVLALDTGHRPADVAIAQRVAYVGLGDAAHAVSVWDVDQPGAPFQIMSVPTPGAVHCVHVGDARLLVGGAGFLQVYDITNPSAPVALGSLAVAGAVTDIATEGDLAAIVEGSHGRLVDLAVPALPEVVATFAVPEVEDVMSVAMRDGIAWVGSRDQYQARGQMRWFDLATPAAPIESRSDRLGAWPAAIDIVFGNAYTGGVHTSSAGDSRGRFDVYLLGDVATPRLGFLDLPAQGSSVSAATLAGDWLYAVGELELSVLSLADLSAPELVDTAWLGAGFGRGVGLVDHWLIASVYFIPSHYWLQLYDVTDPAAPQPAGTLDFGDDAIGLAVRGGLVYVGGLGDPGSGAGIAVYSIGDAGTFILEGEIWPDAYAGALAFQDDGRALFYRDGQYVVADLTDPLAPVDLGTLSADLATIMAWQGDRLYAHHYVEYGTSSWRIIDIEDLGAPDILSETWLPDGEYVEDIAVRDGVVYVCGRDRQYVYDADEPLAPVLAGTFSNHTTGSAPFLLQHDAALVVASGRELATWPYHCVTTAAADPDVLPGGTLRVAAAPNPFNPRTTLRFSLPAAAETTLRVVDLRGRVVRTLVSGRLPAGDHTVVWDGRDGGGREMPSGVYFSRLLSDGRVVAGRMVLVR
jgi:hypothetical protein